MRCYFATFEKKAIITLVLNSVQYIRIGLMAVRVRPSSGNGFFAAPIPLASRNFLPPQPLILFFRSGKTLVKKGEEESTLPFDKKLP